MPDSTADQQRKALEDFNRLTFLFASRVQGTDTPFPASADFDDLHIREVFGRLEGLFTPGTWRVVVESGIERFLTSRSLGGESISTFNSRVGRARQALLKEIRGQRWTWGRLAALLAFLAATGIPLYNFVHDKVFPGSVKEDAKVPHSPNATTPKRASHRVKLAVHDVSAEGCENKAETFTVVSPSPVDAAAGGQGAAPAGWEFELAGNGSHGIRGVSVSGSTLSFTLHAEGGGTVQGGSFGVPKVCVGATGANSSAVVYAYVFSE
jgi:hypothetical protein